MQVAPIKPTLKAPGSEPLKPKCDKLLSEFAFNFNLRRYIEARGGAAIAVEPGPPAAGPGHCSHYRGVMCPL